MFVYNEDAFKFLSGRLKENSNEVMVILKLLREKGEMYHDNILKLSGFSDMKFRPILISLYSSGFIDKTVEGNMKYYSINQNGIKLLENIQEGSK